LTINQVADYELFQNFDNIGMQNGGWTSRWQGFEGNSMWLGENRRMSNATSILDGLKNLKENIDFIYPKYSSFKNTTKIQF
jgi:beta-glucosidase